ncbi:MAG: hypothetical protein M3P83_07300 [Actinomycetota bacterium]|nr:hypothetical protein [Actinomycetota bacterium]
MLRRHGQLADAANRHPGRPSDDPPGPGRRRSLFPTSATAWPGTGGKAQELISRYALDRLVEEAVDDSAAGAVVARRLWIDPPYVLGKAALIDAVARENRCRSVTTDDLGFCTMVGEARDLDGVELLVTSLLVQADAAMLRCGRQQDWRGRSRTTSFRRSFLFAFAARIGERLAAANQGVLAESGRIDQLLPVLRRRGERVDAAVEELFPRLVSRETSISNSHGWAAGRAAADLALLDTNLRIPPAPTAGPAASPTPAR